MEPIAALTSSQDELDKLIQILSRGDSLTCLGKSKKGGKCHNKLSKNTRIRLSQLFKERALLLKNFNEQHEKMLEEASSLVMCVRYHQEEAPSKLKEWLVGSSDTTCQYGDHPSPNPTSKMSKSLIQNSFSWEEKHDKLINTVDASDINEASEFHDQSSFPSADLDDSGVDSGNDEDVFNTQSVASEETKATFKTPQKAIQPASTDSGISMSYDTSVESNTKTTEYGDTPESPLTGKTSKAKQGTRKNQLPRPAPTPIQPMSLPMRPKRNFAPFDRPFTKMQAYIRKSLGSGETDLKGGYIYAFQLDGCAYTKIGKSAIRKDKPPEASLGERMKEHERACCPALKIVLRMPVPFVGRVENLIKIHLEAGRMKEKCLCKGSDGQILTHGNHTEWFSHSLDEIWTVVIAWQHWILSMPYTQDDKGLYQLRPEWEEHLEGVGNLETGRDVWLDWLCKHVPELRGVLMKDTNESSESIETQSAAKVPGSFVRSSATGLKSEIKRVRTTVL